MLKVVVDELRQAKADVAGTVIRWVDAPATGDVMLRLLPDRILLLPPSLQGVDCDKVATACNRYATVILGSKLHGDDRGPSETLAQALHAVARATNLLRIAANLTYAGGDKSKFEVNVKLRSMDGKALPYTKDQVPDLHAGDHATITLHNNGLSSVDATLLYVDARYGINVLFPKAGESNRLDPRSTYDVEVDIGDDTLGVERMLSIAVDAVKKQERADFSFLAQPSLAASRGLEGPDGSDPDVMAFMDAGYSAYRTRSETATPRAPSSRTSMQVFTFNVGN